LLTALLLATRLNHNLGAALRGIQLTWLSVFGTDIDVRTSPLYLPGTMLVVVVLATSVLHRMPAVDLKRAFGSASRVMLGAGVALIFAVPMVRVLIHSDLNHGGYPSMPIALASWVFEHVGVVWPAVAGAAGALGAFIAGSNTVSNMMLVQFQYGIAQKLAVSGLLMVALQAVGAAAGNMIAIHNIVAASASVGLLGQEGATLRKTMLPTLVYLVAVGALGLWAIYGMGISDPIALLPKER
jgi:lactate permease